MPAGLFPKEALARLVQHESGQFLVAFSGGQDSTALLHALIASELPGAIRAIHINHGLQAEASQWQQHCEAFCQQLGVPITICKVTLPDQGSLETRARIARYQAFEANMSKNDLLLLAHHREDQIETGVLQLLRGHGGLGINGMPASRKLGASHLFRPLLRVSRAEIEAYVRQHCLPFVEDPSNADTRHDRNFVRHELIPTIRTRVAHWPNQFQRQLEQDQISRSLLVSYGLEDVERLGSQKGFSVAGLQQLEPDRGLHVLRTLIMQRAQLVPTRGQSQAAYRMATAVNRREPASMILGDYELHCDRDYFELVPAIKGDQKMAVLEGKLQPDVDLGGMRLTARLGPGGVKLPPEATWSLSWPGQSRVNPESKRLSELLREHDVPAWVRQRLPVLTCRGQLLAVPALPDWACKALINEQIRCETTSEGWHYALIRRPS